MLIETHAHLDYPDFAPDFDDVLGRATDAGLRKRLDSYPVPRLYDAYDKYLRHYRRYQLKEVSQLLERAGLTVVTESHLGCVLYPAFVFVKPSANLEWKRMTC